ncbi:hypothetical protein HDU76_010714 [Blyttiomyces sp. JEL0837]|nr:hypothetical protein HDU76_010714 [Blyttiomyces sp. JEL0837]
MNYYGNIYAPVRANNIASSQFMDQPVFTLAPVPNPHGRRSSLDSSLLAKQQQQQQQQQQQVDWMSKSDKKRYTCNFEGCGKVFTTSGHLARHKKLHTGVKSFSCPVTGCPNKFARRDNMLQHAKSHFRKLAQQQGSGQILDPNAISEFLAYSQQFRSSANSESKAPPDQQTLANHQKQLDIEALHEQLNRELDLLQQADMGDQNEGSSSFEGNFLSMIQGSTTGPLVEGEAGSLFHIRETGDDFDTPTEGSSRKKMQQRPRLCSRRSSLVLAPNISSRRRSFTDPVGFGTGSAGSGSVSSSKSIAENTNSLVVISDGVVELSGNNSNNNSQSMLSPQPPRHRQHSDHVYNPANLGSPYTSRVRRKSMPTPLPIQYQPTAVMPSKGESGLHTLQIPTAAQYNPSLTTNTASLTYNPTSSLDPDFSALYSTVTGASNLADSVTLTNLLDYCQEPSITSGDSFTSSSSQGQTNMAIGDTMSPYYQQQQQQQLQLQQEHNMQQLLRHQRYGNLTHSQPHHLPTIISSPNHFIPTDPSSTSSITNLAIPMSEISSSSSSTPSSSSNSNSTIPLSAVPLSARSSTSTIPLSATLSSASTIPLSATPLSAAIQNSSPMMQFEPYAIPSPSVNSNNISMNMMATSQQASFHEALRQLPYYQVGNGSLSIDTARVMLLDRSRSGGTIFNDRFRDIGSSNLSTSSHATTGAMQGESTTGMFGMGGSIGGIASSARFAAQNRVSPTFKTFEQAPAEQNGGGGEISPGLSKDIKDFRLE